MICHGLAIGNEKSLPWTSGNDWDAKDASYDTNRLVGDTLALLTRDTPVIVRMETLRRAVIYAATKEPLTQDLAHRLIERSEQANADPLAAFDAGYFIEAVHQYRETRSLERDGWLFARPKERGQRKGPCRDRIWAFSDARGRSMAQRSLS